MFKFLFQKKASPSIPAVAMIEDDDIPRYPPFAKGLPAAATKRILQTQSDLISRIRGTLRFSGTEFDEIVVPVIERYAAYVHLLPASEAHHHRGAGGLFRHGLEVGQWAAQRAESHFFCVGDTQKTQRENETRWQFAAFLGGLLHDVGKPLSDVAVTDKTGKKEWNPYDSSLADWLQLESIDRYFLRWRDKRNKRHEKFSMMNLDQIIVPRAKSYLNKPGPYIMEALLEAIVGTGASEALTQLVLWADQESVKRDLSNQRLEVDEYAYGVPVERFIFDALRRLVLTVKINEPGATIWRLEKGIFLSWQATVQDIHAILDRDKVPGVPRSPDTLADILIERGFAVPYQESPEKKPVRYWRIYPEALKGVPLLCVRIDDIELIFTSEPPAPVKASFTPPPKTASTTGSTTHTSASPQSGIPQVGNKNVTAPIKGVGPSPADIVSWDDIDAEAAGQDAMGVPPAYPLNVGHSRVPSANSKANVSATPTKNMGAGNVVSEQNEDRDERVNRNPTPEARGFDGVAKGHTQQTPGWDMIHSAMEKSREGIATLELLPDGSYGIPYPASAQLLGIPRDVMNVLSDEGMLRLDQTSSSKTQSIGGKKYLVLGREISRYVKNGLQDEAQRAESPCLPISKLTGPELDSKFRKNAETHPPINGRVESSSERNEIAAKTKEAKQPVQPFSQDTFIEEFTQQIIQGFGPYIVGEVDTQISESATVFRISMGCIQRISELINQNPVVVRTMIRQVPGIRIETNKGTEDYIELVQ